MRKKVSVSIFAIVLIAVMIMSILPACAQAEQEQGGYPDYTKVIDKDDQLTDSEEQSVNEALAKASQEAGIPICAYVFTGSYSEEYWGDDFLAEYGLDSQSPLVLLVVTVTYYEIFYNIYTYGDAYLKINEKEIGYILDDSTVYLNIKEGDIAVGLCEYAALSAEAYAGRLGVSWALILIIALIVGAVAGRLTVKGIAAGYKKKNPSQSYPLDRFAKLELTRENDREIGKFVTTTIISSGGHGGRGGGGRTGGGGGHRGGR